MSVTIVAECSINHGGNPTVAVEMFRAAAAAGCDGVKLQTFRASDFLPQGHPDFAMFHNAEIWQHLRPLVKEAHELGLQIGTTPTSIEGVKEAVEAGVDFLKNGSDFLLRTDLIEAMLATGLPTWVSTGMATLREIYNVDIRARKMLCTSMYPCPDEEIHMERFRSGRFKGFSDHTAHGSVAAVMAVAHGARMIERHFCVARTAESPDAAWSLTPQEMTWYVTDIRRAEKMIGESFYPTPGEVENRERWRVTKETLRS